MSNLLPLETWRKYFGYNPFHFFGLSNEALPITSACNSLVFKYQWQGSKDAVGRSEIEQAIEAAETRLQEYLGYAIAPHYAAKTVPFSKYLDVSVWRRGIPFGSDGYAENVALGEGYVQGLGTELITALGDVPVAITDTDADGIRDTFTASIATTETDPARLAVYFIAADRLDGATLGEDSRVRPVSISITGGVASIRGRSYLLVKPVKYEGIITNTGKGFDPNDVTGTYVANITVATRVVYTAGQTVDTAQATLLWESVPCYGWWGCCDTIATNAPAYTPNSNDPAAVGMAVARAGIRDAKLGLIIPVQAVYDTTAAQWRAIDWSTYRQPDRVTLRYLAGWPLGPDGNVDRKWQVIVARMAAAELARPICACDVANQELYHWQFDVSRAGGANSEQYSISPADLDNPLGTRRGQVWAWKQIRNLRFGGGTRVG